MTLPPVVICWKCTWCGFKAPLPELWVHLKDAHGWDREHYQEICDRPRVSRDRVVAELPLGMYRWNDEED